MTWKERLEEERQALQTLRDEVRLQIHLGAADAKEAWEKVEKDFEHLEGRLKSVRQASRESADEVGAATRTLLREVREGYERIRELL